MVAPSDDIPLCILVAGHRKTAYSGDSHRGMGAVHNTRDGNYNLPFEEEVGEEEEAHESCFRNSGEELLVEIKDAWGEAWEDNSLHELQAGAVVFENHAAERRHHHPADDHHKDVGDQNSHRKGLAHRQAFRVGQVLFLVDLLA